MKKNFISNSTTSVRIFKNDVLEALSKVHFTVPLIIYVPVVIYLSYQAFTIDASILLFALNLGGGIIIWTITEYLLHRFVFHFQPTSAWGRRLHFIFHGVHHDYPRDAKRLVMPPSASIPIAVGLYCFCLLFFYNKAHLYAFFSGFLIGYLTYDMMHYAMHHHSFKNTLMKKIKEHHMLHHYGDATKGYGVSTVLWDIVFRSNFTKKEKI
jgi:sterol desaturase/sphingolipid hydroxylase (fatty acid hydroxylase superfamily)